MSFASVRTGCLSGIVVVESMTIFRVAALVLLFLFRGAATPLAGAAGTAEEENKWPVVVRQVAPDGQVQSWTGAGPFAFAQPTAEGTVSGVRPFWIEMRDAQGDFRAGYALYPLFSYRLDATIARWSIFELIRGTGRRAGAPPPVSQFEPRQEFEFWPFWFSRTAGDPAESYRGLLPIAGTVRNKLGMERFHWILFPLYAEIEKRGAVTTHTPWPFVRVTRGAAHGGGFWPLYTAVERPGVSRTVHYLWPLGFDITRQPSPDDPPGTRPRREVGFLPFYARSTGPGFLNLSIIWPFFGYTEQVQPVRYFETRYFWPLFVQGRGDERMVNRWGPFYTHSIKRGYDKRWYAWPLVRRTEWEEQGLLRTKMQLLYFLYVAHRQRSLAHPELPEGKLTHYWPLLSTWDNGAGRKQWQFLSPFDVLFPGNVKIQHAWTPLFTLARHDQTAPGETRTSLLWDAVTWRRHAKRGEREIHVGPLFSVVEHPEQKRVAFGNGLFGFQRAPRQGWRMFWLDFSHKTATITARSGS